MGNFCEGYLDNAEQHFSTVEVMSRLSTASRFVCDSISKLPVMSRSKLDEGLIETSSKLDQHVEKHAAIVLEKIVQSRMSVTQSFVENLRAVNNFYNKLMIYLFDRGKVKSYYTNEVRSDNLFG